MTYEKSLPDWRNYLTPEEGEQVDEIESAIALASTEIQQRRGRLLRIRNRAGLRKYRASRGE